MAGSFDVNVNGRSVGYAAAKYHQQPGSDRPSEQWHDPDKTAENGGVSRAMLSKLYKEGLLSRLAAGQYVFAWELGDDMLSLSRRSGFIVFHTKAPFP